MTTTLNSLLVIVLLLNLYALGTSRIGAVIRAVALQGAVLGAMPLLIHKPIGLIAVLMCLGMVTLKGLIIPWMMMRAMRDAHIRREVEPLIGPLPTMILGALGTGFAVIFADRLPLAPAEKKGEKKGTFCFFSSRSPKTRMSPFPRPF